VTTNSDIADSADTFDFSGLWIPLITPFRHGKVDRPAITQLVRRLCADGIQGLVVCGSTGEAAALTKGEQLDVLSATLDAAAGRPVVMGVSGYNLRDTQEWIRQLAAFPLSGVLAPAPHYIRPSQAGLLGWFHGLADASAAPLIIYDIPYRTGVRLERDTLLQLAAYPRIRAIKDCGGDTAKTLALIAHGGLQVLAGEDLQLFSTVAQGGAGAVTASAHLQTRQFVRIIALLRSGDLHAARALWTPLVPWIEGVFAEPNPAPIKAMLAREGAIHNELRAPMTAASQDHIRHMEGVRKAFA
jgi:4-hydroxy-tetrahydrodipicolinate synthase